MLPVGSTPAAAPHPRQYFRVMAGRVTNRLGGARARARRQTVIFVVAGTVLFLHLLGTWIPGAHSPPTSTDVTEFLDQVWAEFVATLAGVGFGIPAGLYIEAAVERRTERAADERRRRRRQKVASILLGSLQHNLEMLRHVEDAISRDRGMLEVGFDTARWSVIQQEAHELFPDVELAAELAHVYSQFAGVRNLLMLYRDYTVGVLSASPDVDWILPQAVDAILGNVADLERMITDVIPRIAQSTVEVKSQDANGGPAGGLD